MVSEFPEEVLTNFGKLFYRMDKARSYKSNIMVLDLVLYVELQNYTKAELSLEIETREQKF